MFSRATLLLLAVTAALVTSRPCDDPHHTTTDPWNPPSSTTDPWNPPSSTTTVGHPTITTTTTVVTTPTTTVAHPPPTTVAPSPTPSPTGTTPGGGSGGNGGNGGNGGGNGGHSGGSTCSTGPVQCCNSVQHAGAPAASNLLGLLGVVVQDLNVPVGLTCSPISVIGGGSGANCNAQTVCCENNNFSGLIAIGCTPINIQL